MRPKHWYPSTSQRRNRILTKKSYKPKGHVTEAARSLQSCLHADSTFQEGELSEELCTHLCSVQSFFCFVFLAHGNIQVLQWCNHACCPGVTCLHCRGCVQIQADLQCKHKHKHESHMTAQTSRHTIQAQAQS